MQDLDRMVQRKIYFRFLKTGLPPTIAEVARSLHLPESDIEASFHSLAKGRAIVLHPLTTQIWMANPFSAVPTPFTVRVAKCSWYGNCIWDGLGVLALADADGVVETSCPDCREPLAPAIENGALKPFEGVVHFAVPAAHWWDDIEYT